MNNKVLSKAISDIAFVSGQLAAIGTIAERHPNKMSVVSEEQVSMLSTLLDDAVMDLIALTAPTALSTKTLEQMALLVKKFKEQHCTHLQAKSADV